MADSFVVGAAGFDPIFGDLSRLGEMRSVEVKGNLVRSRARYLREHHGEASIAAIAARVSGEARAYLLQPPLVSEWVRFGPLMDIDRAIIEGPMSGDVSRMRPFGEAIAKYDLPNVYKVLLKTLSSPEFLMRRTGLIYSMYLRPGKITCESEAGTAHVILSERMLPAYFCRHGMSGWLAASLAVYGATGVILEHTRCRHRGHETCNWELRWR